MKIVCLRCHPDEDSNGLCKIHEKEFAEFLIGEGCDISEPNNKTKHLTDKQIGTGSCIICGTLCFAPSFCYGCAEFVCAKCIDTPSIVAGKHTSKAHFDAINIKPN